jgi:hypothetical protein
VTGEVLKASLHELETAEKDQEQALKMTTQKPLYADSKLVFLRVEENLPQFTATVLLPVPIVSAAEL